MEPRLLRPILAQTAKRWGPGALMRLFHAAPARPPVQVTNLYQTFCLTARLGVGSIWPITWGSRAAKGAQPTGRILSAFVGEALNGALRAELDRQLRLLKRGEGVEENRRRQGMLERYAKARHPQLGRFPALIFAPLPAPEPALLSERETHVVRQVHTTERVLEREGAPAPLPEHQLRRLTDQVAGLVERRLRLEGERRGKFH